MHTVIFACVHNAGRSQMAAAWFNRLADPARARAISAGTEPGVRVHPVVVDAMREVGVDVAGGTPRKLTDDLARGADLLVTMGCGEQCPVVPGLRRDDWPLEDPELLPIERVREIRDAVRARVVALLRREGWGVVRAARPEDRAAVGALLAAASLPTDGVEEHFGSFLVADEGGTVVGAAGLELYGEVALLRSVVVAEAARGSGLGTTLTERAIDEARARAVSEVYLLTTTAESFFPRFGFARVARGDLPGALGQSRELLDACPSTAIAMRCEVR